MNLTFTATLTLIAALGCGLVAGVFFAFSTFVMPALGRLPTAHGIAAMQSINVKAINPLFMVALFGTAAACVWLEVIALQSWREPGAVCLLVGSTLYLLGNIVVTIGFNVPLNNALAAVQPDSADGTELWHQYLRRWNAWNHVRTVTALGAAALLTLAILKPAAV